MREAWFEIIKGARDRKGVSEAYKRSSKKKLDEREAAERELDNRRGKKGSILDEKGRKTLQDVKDLTSEEIRQDSRSMNQSRKEEFKEGAKRAGEALVGGAKKGWKGLLQAGKKGAKALNPNTYLPDPSATGTGKPLDIRAKDPISGKFKFNRITTKDAKKKKAEALAVKTEKERKDKSRLDVAGKAGEAALAENYGIHEKRLEESRRQAEQTADSDARQELMAQQQLQAKDTRDAKIKQMGEVNQQRAEAARKEANTTIMPELTGLKPKPVPSVSVPKVFSGNNTLNIQGSKQQPPPPKKDSRPRAAVRAAKLRRAYLERGKAQTEAANYKPEQPEQNPNEPTQPQTVVTPPPPPKPQTRQPTQEELQMSQQGQQQQQQTQAALQGQAAAQQKRANWKNVMLKPQAPPKQTPIKVAP